MAISQVTKGVFVISPDQQKRYQDTAAGQYTSVFTKNRADQWEMAQKQSLMEMDLGAKRFAAEMELYQKRQQDLDARAKALEAAIADAGGDNAKLAQAAKIAVEREKTDRLKEEARRDELRSAVMNQPVGGGTSTTVKPASTSTSVSTGGGGGGGGTSKVPKLGTADANEIGGAIRTGGGSATAAASDIEARKAAGKIVGKTGPDAVAVNAGAVQAMIEDRAGKGVNRDDAERQVLAELQQGGYGQYVTDYGSHMDALETPGTGGGGPRTTVTTRPGTTSTTVRTGGGSVAVPKFPGLPGLDLPEPVIDPAVIDLAALLKQREAIDAERAGLMPPSLPDMDYITRARGIMAGRFGPTNISPAPAYAQRNALAYLASAPKDVVQAAYQEYLKTLPPPPAPAPVMTPMQKQQADVAAARGAGILGPNPELDALLGTPVPSAEGLRAPVVQESLASRMFRERSPTFGQGGTAEAAPPIGINVPPPPEMGTKPEPVEPTVEQKRRTLGDILLHGFKPEYDRVTGELIAPQLTGPERAEAIQGIDMQSPGRQARLFPESLLPPYPREVNGQSFRPLSYAETQVNPEGERTLQEQRVALESMFPEGIPPQFTAKLAPPPVTPAPRLPTMTPPPIQIEPVPSPARMSPVPPPESLGEKPTGEIPVYPAVPGVAPAAERPPLSAPRPAGPSDVVGRAENTMGAAKKLADIKAASKAGIGGETAGVGAKKNPTAETYLFYRMESALDLSKKDDKLRRLVASGPGKIANDLYIANKSKGVPFNRTWEEITMTFNQDKEAMAKAHEVALALDMKANDQKTPKE
jgi:hypothetical protein